MDFNNVELVRSVANERRYAMEQQVMASDIKSALCDQIRAHRLGFRIEDELKEIKISRPNLYEYLCDLESVKEGIWCPNCAGIKNVAGLEPAEGLLPHESTIRLASTKRADVVAKPAAANKPTEDITKALKALTLRLNEARAECEDKMSNIMKAITDLAASAAGSMSFQDVMTLGHSPSLQSGMSKHEQDDYDSALKIWPNNDDEDDEAADVMDIVKMCLENSTWGEEPKVLPSQQDGTGGSGGSNGNVSWTQPSGSPWTNDDFDYASRPKKTRGNGVASSADLLQ